MNLPNVEMLFLAYFCHLTAAAIQRIEKKPQELKLKNSFITVLINKNAHFIA